MQTKHLNADKMQTNRKERMRYSTWRVSDCEELVGLLTGNNGFDLEMSVSV